VTESRRLPSNAGSKIVTTYGNKGEFGNLASFQVRVLGGLRPNVASRNGLALDCGLASKG